MLDRVGKQPWWKAFALEDSLAREQSGRDMPPILENSAGQISGALHLLGHDPGGTD